MKKIHSIKTKLIASFLLISAIPLVATVSFIYFDTFDLLMDSFLSNEEHDTAMKKIEIDDFLSEVRGDLLFLSELSSLRDVINSEIVVSEKNEVDEGVSNDSEEFDKTNNTEKNKKLTEDFLSFSKQKEIYYQIRYIDEGGQEVVRVDSIDNNFHIIEENNLQNKGDRYYFKDTMRAEKGTVFISPLDLNIEKGKVENRGTEEEPKYVPVIRYGIKVFDNNENPKGIIITNIYADNFLMPLAEIFLGQDNQKETYLVNKDGYYLHHPDKNKEWGFMLNKENERVTRDYEELNIVNKAGDNISVIEDKNNYFVFQRVYPGNKPELISSGYENDPSYSESRISGDEFYWVLVTKVEKRVVAENLKDILIKYILFSLLTILLVVIFILFISRSITEPIDKLEKAIRIVEKGNLDHGIKIRSKDEIGELAKSFKDMTRSLRSYRDETEKKVIERTSDLEKLNKHMIGRELKMMELKKEIKKLKSKNN